MRIYRFFAVEMSYTVIVDGPGWIASDREPRAGGISNIHVSPWFL